MPVFSCGKREFSLSKRAYVMGILNITPDSFSDGGKWNTPKKALERALEIEKEGADFIDIGAQSTRPGFTKISQEEEAKRLIPVLKEIRGKLKIPISIDTFYPYVAEIALDLGADIINDVNGFKDEEMFRVASKSDCGCLIMHSGANLETIKPFFEEQIGKALSYNIDKKRICLDPGIGFGKSYEENLLILKDVNKYKIDGCAMLIGASRKRVIGESCGNPPFSERMPGTIAAHTLAVASGADIIRVHDVKEAVQAAKVASKIVFSQEEC